SKKRPEYGRPALSQVGQYPWMAYMATGPDFPDFLIEPRASCARPQVASLQVNVDFLGTVPPRPSVKKVSFVSGHSISSGSGPRTSISLSVLARSLFHAAVAFAVSVTLPPNG